MEDVYLYRYEGPPYYLMHEDEVEVSTVIRQDTPIRLKGDVVQLLKGTELHASEIEIYARVLVVAGVLKNQVDLSEEEVTFTVAEPCEQPVKICASQKLTIQAKSVTFFGAEVLNPEFLEWRVNEVKFKNLSPNLMGLSVRILTESPKPSLLQTLRGMIPF